MVGPKTKEGEFEADVSKMTSRIDQAIARSTLLYEKIRILEPELAALEKKQAEMNNIRLNQQPTSRPPRLTGNWT